MMRVEVTKYNKRFGIVKMDAKGEWCRPQRPHTGAFSRLPHMGGCSLQLPAASGCKPASRVWLEPCCVLQLLHGTQQ
jgi:hypothetical protein